MAPDICREVLTTLPQRSRILDPMCGSGTVLRNAVELGHDAVGLDLDPLSVLLSQAWTTAIPTHRLIQDASAVSRRAATLAERDVTMPWRRQETQDFAEYWFADRQRDELARLATVLRRSRLRTLPFMWVCLSRLIVTKDRGASLARDVSHSRPHKVAEANDFDCFDQFVGAARIVASRLQPARIQGQAVVVRGDVRKSDSMELGKFSTVITSPPYLNAIDYLRGHRLSLIWLGHEVDDLREVRSEEIGAERGSRRGPFDVRRFISIEEGTKLPSRYVGWINRYATDILRTTKSLARVIKPGGTVVLVVGNSLIRGARVDNAGVTIECARTAGLELVNSKQRTIPARRRYLPLPVNGTALSKRIREETILTFQAPVRKSSQ